MHCIGGQTVGQCFKANKPKPKPMPKSIPKPKLKDSAGGLLQGRLTWYQFNGGIAYCDGKNYSDDALIVALSSSVLQGHTNCGKKARIYTPNSSIEVTSKLPF